MIRKALILLTLCILPLASLSPQAMAQGAKPPGKHKSAQGAANSKQAAAMARQRNPGKVLSVKRANGYFKVKMMHEGTIRYITIKAQ